MKKFISLAKPSHVAAAISESYKSSFPPASLEIHLNPDPINPDIDPHACSPGSTISGTVFLKVYRDFNAQSIKILFVGAESINFLLLGWNGDDDNGRIFTSRSPVWTAPPPSPPSSPTTDTNASNTSNNTRPNLEVGEMMFPFAFEMPMVNYPPLAELQRITSTMTIVACLEQQGGRITYSPPCVLNFQPIIETPVNNNSSGPKVIESKEIGKGDIINFSVEKLFENNAPEVRVYLNRCLTVRHGKKESKEYTAVSEVTAFLAPKNADGSGTRRSSNSSNVNKGRRSRDSTNSTTVPTTATATATSTSTTAATALVVSPSAATGPLELDVNIQITPDMIPSLTYSKRCSIHYELCVSVRDTTSFFSFGKKDVFSVGLFFGTLSCGTRSPVDLLAFTDEVVTPDNPVTKPRRVDRRPISAPPPAYDDFSPPVYTEEALSTPG
ncbi:hypothetical protein F4703DRAFT_1855350 [Phycomyces blakesleeanus]